jgi:adenosylcobinamide-phosphate synthase
MSLFALITALLLEQIQPLSSRKYLFGLLSGYVKFFRQRFNEGNQRHGTIAWLLAVLPFLAGAIALYFLLYRVSPILAWAFNVLVLYLTMGFRQSSHYFTDIHQALREDRLEDARRLLSDWRGIPSQELNAEEVARLTIENALVASHRNVFGVIVWFVLFSSVGLGGAAGAFLYRLGQFLRWHLEEELEDHISGQQDESATEDFADGDSDRGEFGGFSRLAFHFLDWLPVRLTAITFAIVGNFEDTIYCWRTQATSWPDAETGILLSSGAGARGVRLGMPMHQGGLLLDRPEMGVGDDADTGFMQSTVGLVWRSVVFWLILLLLLTLSNLVG